MSKGKPKRRQFIIKLKQKRKKKIKKLKEKYSAAKSKEEKERILEKIRKVSPHCPIEEILKLKEK